MTNEEAVSYLNHAAKYDYNVPEEQAKIREIVKFIEQQAATIARLSAPYSEKDKAAYDKHVNNARADYCLRRERARKEYEKLGGMRVPFMYREDIDYTAIGIGGIIQERFHG